MTRYWQQAAGDNDRNYAALCLKWGVILNGPGSKGPWPECSESLKNTGWSAKKITDLRRFSEGMESGDVVVLRLGTNTVVGVGILLGGYQWLDIFGDVDGWSLQHVRRVKWLWSDVQDPKRFDTYALKQGDTTQRLTSEVVIDWINSLNLNLVGPHELVSLPEDSKNAIEFESISEFLFDKGVSSTAIATLSNEINELIRIAKWYQKFGNPSEFETVAYLAVPLLRALGWTPQRMAIEWNNVDIALFSALPRENDNLSVVVEAKKKGNSCLTAFSQAQSYAATKTNCRRLIVTDGLRYGVYFKRDGGNFELYAYFNITRLRAECPIYECHGVYQALLAMTPDWTEQT